MHVKLTMHEGAGFTAASTTKEGTFGCPFVKSVEVAGSAMPASIKIEHDEELNEVRLIVDDECVWSGLLP